MSTTSSRDTRKTSGEASAVGARNDDSSLFSLESLMRVEQASTVGSATKEDSRPYRLEIGGLDIEDASPGYMKIFKPVYHVKENNAG